MKPAFVSSSFSVIVACGVSVACGNPSAPVIADDLTVQAAAPNLELTNQSTAPVYTAIVDADRIGVWLWSPCADPATCNALQPSEHRQVPYTKIFGYSPSSSREAIVRWWHLVPDSTSGTGFRADSIRSIRVGL